MVELRRFDNVHGSDPYGRPVDEFPEDVLASIKRNGVSPSFLTQPGIHLAELSWDSFPLPVNQYIKKFFCFDISAAILISRAACLPVCWLLRVRHY